MSTGHARLSPSSASRWLQCPGSVALIDALPPERRDRPSPYADEGTRAHELAELTAAYRFGLRDEDDYLTRRQAWKSGVPDADQRAEMEAHAMTYCAVLAEVLAVQSDASLRLEQRLRTPIKGCWGTADAVVVSPTRLHVIDYKYGKGVKVDADDNPQLMLYGLGALDAYDVLGRIETVTLTIVQPRISGHVSSWTVAADALRAWGRSIEPIAESALTGDAWLAPSESACRFCPAAGDCRARAEDALRRDFGDPRVLDPDELAQALQRAPQIRAWLADLEAAALDRIMNSGETVPGYKVVASGGRRTIPDAEAAIAKLVEHGFDVASIAKRSLLPLAKLDKLVGADELSAILGHLMVRSEGKPSLAHESDPRKPYETLSASDEFAALTDKDVASLCQSGPTKK